MWIYIKANPVLKSVNKVDTITPLNLVPLINKIIPTIKFWLSNQKEV